MNRSALLLASGVLVLSMPGCGSSGDETEPVTFEEYVGSFITDYDPASSLSDLSARSTVATDRPTIGLPLTGTFRTLDSMGCVGGAALRYERSACVSSLR